MTVLLQHQDRRQARSFLRSHPGGAKTRRLCDAAQQAGGRFGHVSVKALSTDKHSLLSPEEFRVMAEKFLKEG
jgi:hypothetical protein